MTDNEREQHRDSEGSKFWFESAIDRWEKAYTEICKATPPEAGKNTTKDEAT